MRSESYRLSIEELAFAMGVVGGAESAGGFLQAILGDRSRPELEGRLLAASHSLIARGLLHFDIQTQSQHLDDSLAALVDILLHSDFSIRCSRSVNGYEALCTFFYRQQSVVQHQVVQAVVCSIRRLESPEAAITSSLEFFGLGNMPQEKPTPPVGIVPVTLLEQLQEQSRGAEKDKMSASLVAAGISPVVAGDLTEDLCMTEYRGSVIRVDNRNGQAVSDRGFLILKGSRRFWLLEILAQPEPRVRIFYGSTDQYRSLFNGMLTEEQRR